MNELSKRIISECRIRRGSVAKARFRLLLKAGFEKMGYEPELATDRFFLKNRNVVVGDPDKAQYIFTAHYDTPAASLLPGYFAPRSLFFTFGYKLLYLGLMLAAMFAAAGLCGLGFWVPAQYVTQDTALQTAICSAAAYCGAALPLLLALAFPNKQNANGNTSGVVTLTEIAAKLSAEQRDKVAFVFFDHGCELMLGSGGFAERHAHLEDKTAVNFDCVGQGDEIAFIFRGRADLESEFACSVRQAAPADKQILTISSALTAFFSDHRNFKNGIGVVAMKKSRMSGGYVGRVGTCRDKRLDERNINLISDIITKAVK